LYQIDPVAKSCLPAQVEVFQDSVEYGASFSNETQGDVIGLNILYRLGENYIGLRRIEQYILRALREVNDQGNTKGINDYILDAKGLGQVFGTQFRLMFSRSKFEIDYSLPTIDQDGGIFSAILGQDFIEYDPEAEVLPDLYVYPDSNLVIEEPTFDYIIFPNETTTVYPDYYEL